VYTFPIADCDTTYANAHHDYPAADMFAARECPFVSPVSGVVDEVETEDTWDSSTNIGAARGGRSVSVVGDDGVRYYGSHLESVADGIRPGVRVSSGDVLGYIGDSGSAAGTGTHLHFALSWPTPPGYWWVRRGTLPPAAFLDDWRAGRQTSPVQAVAAAKRAYGDDSECHVYC
jgi:murein DD-endopeptidase MepM/ murein hydrolase activator NlpD